MIRRTLTHPTGLPISGIAITEAAPQGAGPTPESKVVTGRSSNQRVDDLLRAFSDTAYASEEEDHPWESWNYTRLSTF